MTAWKYREGRTRKLLVYAIERQEPFEYLDPFVPFGLTFEIALEKQAQDWFSQSDRHKGYDSERLMMRHPEGEPHILVRSQPEKRGGVALTFRTTGEKMGMTWMAPFFLGSTQLPATLEGIIISRDRMLGILQLDVGKELTLEAYAPIFGADRMYYKQGMRGEWRFSAIVHGYSPAVDPPVPLQIPESMNSYLKSIGKAPESREIKLTGAAMLFPVDDAESFYHIRGPVKACRPFEFPMLEQTVHVLTVTIARINGGDKDIDVELVLTPFVLGDLPPPVAGQDIDALIHLHAELVEVDVTDERLDKWLNSAT